MSDSEPRLLYRPGCEVAHIMRADSDVSLCGIFPLFWRWRGDLSRERASLHQMPTCVRCAEHPEGGQR